jgi:hypothetical protein
VVATRGLSYLLWWLPLNIWPRGLRPVDSSPTLLPPTSLSYSLLVCVRLPLNTWTRGPSSVPSKFPSTGQSGFLSVGQCKVPRNTWIRGADSSKFPSDIPSTSQSVGQCAPQHLDSGTECCKFPSDFPSTGQSDLLFVGQ